MKARGNRVRRGVAVSHGAITIVNAIPSGKGGACGLDLPVEATVLLTRNNIFTVNGKIKRDHPASVTARLMLEHHHFRLGAAINIKSRIPIAKGLKSSSAIQVATAMAVVNALDEKVPDQIKFLNLLVKAARIAGVTVTGGLDDLAACMLGGLVLTDNLNDRLLLHYNVKEYPVILIVPEKSIFTSNVRFQRSSIIIKLFNKIHEIAHQDPFLALTLNGLLYMDLTGLDSKPIRTLLRLPVIAAGLTGKGPCIAIVCEEDEVENVKSEAKKFGRIIHTKLTNKGIFR
ncbi:MAG: shikimate kinase [Candidatus Ranarchaeia archaeon]